MSAKGRSSVFNTAFAQRTLPLNVSPTFVECRDSSGMLTYVIICTVTGRVKIGKTGGDPTKRLSAIQGHSPTELVLIASLTISEEEAHFELMPAHVHGEWFETTCEVEDYIWAHMALPAEVEATNIRESTANRIAYIQRLFDRTALIAAA